MSNTLGNTSKGQIIRIVNQAITNNEIITARLALAAQLFNNPANANASAGGFAGQFGATYPVGQGGYPPGATASSLAPYLPMVVGDKLQVDSLVIRDTNVISWPTTTGSVTAGANIFWYDASGAIISTIQLYLDWTTPVGVNPVYSRSDLITAPANTAGVSAQVIVGLNNGGNARITGVNVLAVKA